MTPVRCGNTATGVGNLAPIPRKANPATRWHWQR
jgi:hypothetical protein